MPLESSTNLATTASATQPDYAGLVQMLVEPLLESPNALKVDCELANQNQRVWLRVAFEGEEKGRVFGRGGRNIQAIRTILNSAAKIAGQSVYLDIYGGKSSATTSDITSEVPGERRRQPRRSSRPKPAMKLRNKE